jgi:hypothetical protein
VARRAAAQVAEPEPEEVEEEAGGFRSQMWKHEAMVEWLNAETGEDINELSAAEIIALAFARRVAWRKSEDYQTLVAEYKASRPVRAPKAESNGDADDEDEEETPAPRKRGRPAKSAAKVTVPATPTKAVRKASKRTGENPFE